MVILLRKRLVLALNKNFKTYFMKKITAILLTLCFFTLSSCSSDDPAPANNEAELYIRFAANGQQFSFEPETIGSIKKLIMGNKFENNVVSRISLWMPTNPTIGTHAFVDDTSDDISNIAYTADFWQGMDVYDATAGSITITSIDGEYIKGTFNFTGTNSNGATTTVSNGTFRAYN